MDDNNSYTYNIDLDTELENFFYLNGIGDCSCYDPPSCERCKRTRHRNKVMNRMHEMNELIYSKNLNQYYQWQMMLKVIEIANRYNYYFKESDILKMIIYLIRNRHHILDIQYQRRINLVVNECNQLYGFDIYLNDYVNNYLDVPEFFFEFLDNQYEDIPNFNV